LKQLEIRCRQSVDDLMKLGVSQSKKRRLSLLDRGSSVLAVAHCDWVSHLPVHFSSVRIPRETLVFSPQLDDRLGVYTALDFLPSIGINTDVLLTDEEEIGRSTAALFDTDKQYNWIVEFDRRGTGAVMYQYDFPCKEYFRVDQGSFSDICELAHLGVQGLNVGVAYEAEHTTRCHMVVEDYAEQMIRFQAMYKELKNKRLEHKRTSFYGRSSFVTESWDDFGRPPELGYNKVQCEECLEFKDGREVFSIEGYDVCFDCYDTAIANGTIIE
jgi:hypothetical protein